MFFCHCWIDTTHAVSILALFLRVAGEMVQHKAHGRVRIAKTGVSGLPLLLVLLMLRGVCEALPTDLVLPANATALNIAVRFCQIFSFFRSVCSVCCCFVVLKCEVST